MNNERERGNPVLIKMKRDTYDNWMYADPIIPDGVIIIVTNIPGWWRYRHTRLKVGDGETHFSKLKYV